MCYNHLMKFEYDKHKSQSNKAKHGIDFEEAKELWHNQSAIVAYEKTILEEDRFSIVGYIANKCYTGIFTLRDLNIRIISVRRCRKNEQKRYEDANNS
ncbi:MAG: BrnT family toxin [Campylobacterota bacterium]|nr:BrnT family toxin [Campylobacterota bacterium]